MRVFFEFLSEGEVRCSGSRRVGSGKGLVVEGLGGCPA